MRRIIQTEHPRTLVLENAVERRLTAMEPGPVRDTAMALARDIRDGGGTAIGPLIQRVSPNERTDAPATHETTLIRQSETPLDARLTSEVAVHDRLEVPGCVLARFRGDASDIQIIYSKIAVHAYENDLTLDGTVYLVFVDEDHEDFAVDAFASTAGEEHAGR